MSEAIHFSHANGFPARCYEPLFERLGCEVSYVEKIGHGEHPVDDRFAGLVTELIQSVERNHQEPVVGVGHSTGGVLLVMAAASRPDLFKALVLLDPVLFCPPKRAGIEISKRLGLKYQIGPVRASKKRRTRFQSLEEVRSRYAQKSVFQQFHPECFEAYMRHGFQSSGRGEEVELAFSAQVETEIFAHTQTRVPKSARGLKGLLLYGSESSLFWPMDARWWDRWFAEFLVRPFDGSHLFPFEDPDGVVREIQRYLSLDRSSSA